jgi:ABC-2 type transport system permease protein
VAPQLVSGLLQKVVMTAAPDALMETGIDQLKRWGGPLTEAQKQAIDVGLEQLRKAGKHPENDVGVESDDPTAAFSGMVPVKVVDLLGQKKSNPLIAYYAAATAVMFLLFSCANGAGSALLEEEESGTLDRLLSSNLSMSQLLTGKWLSLTILGIVQVTLMFIWGAIVFHLELWRHTVGFLLMTATTAAAGAAFGLVLATVCRSRGQLSAISTTVILVMSAVGGSMVPRFVMSETLQNLGLLTFNGWALEGYTKVFWRDASVVELWPQLLVLILLTCIFLVIARALARRWEAA